MTYLEYKHRTEFGETCYNEIDRYCKERKIRWSASPWDLGSLDFLLKYDIPFIKVPSAMLTNKALLEGCLSSGKKVILSTGMSTEDEISEAVSFLEERITVKSKSSYAILHCNSTYPAPLEELNLSCIETLKEKYGCEVGYSGHEFRLGTSVAAVYLGASIIERHITLDRSMWGSDHLSSVEPQGLFKLVSGIRELEKAYGNGTIRVTESEKPVRKKLRG
jgi:N-acetylneuraminate synthase